MEPVLPPKFDPLDPEVLDDPYPTYARLRQAGPLCRGGAAQWVVTRYADVADLISDPRLGSEFPPEYHRIAAGDGPAGAFMQRIVLNRDPPAHTRLRQLMGKAFSRSLVRDKAPRIGELVDELLGPVRDRGRFDAVADLAFPLPVTVLCELIGVPDVDREAIRPHAEDLSRAFALFLPEEARAAADRAVLWLRGYVSELLEERRLKPRNDLLTRMLAAEQGGDALSHDEIVDNTVFLFFAGFETTSNLIATGCDALLEHPQELARLATDPSLVPTAVEEFLRYDAPVQVKGRLVREPIRIGDRTVRAGRVLVLLLGSANRDERQFADPDRLDLGRHPNPHLSFGGGSIHYCLGAALAREEGAAVFGRLVRMFRGFERAGSVVRRPSASFRSYERVPLEVKAA